MKNIFMISLCLFCTPGKRKKQLCCDRKKEFDRFLIVRQQRKCGKKHLNFALSLDLIVEKKITPTHSRLRAIGKIFLTLKIARQNS